MAWYNPISWFGGSGDSERTGYQHSGPGRQREMAAAVDFDGAMTVSAFWASIRLLTEAIASMPIKCYENMPDGSRQEVTDYPLWRLLNYRPNARQTRTEFFESLMLNLSSSGNFYGEKKVIAGRVQSITPLMSSQMRVKLLSDGAVSYDYRDRNGKTRSISAENIWHIKIFGNSYVGMSPIQYAARALGVSIATDDRVGKIAKNGGKVSGLLKIAQVLNPVQRAAVRNNMEDIAGGDSDSLKILEADMDFQQIALSPQDMQLLQNRRFQIEDVARFIGVPSVLINDTAGSTVWGSGIGQIIGGFHKLNLRPYAERIESSLKRWLMPAEDRDRFDIEFDFNALTRADLETRIKTNATAINSGQLSPNEARNKEGRSDKGGGDDIYLNGSLVAAGKEREPLTDEQRISGAEEKTNEEN